MTRGPAIPRRRAQATAKASACTLASALLGIWTTSPPAIRRREHGCMKLPMCRAIEECSAEGFGRCHRDRQQSRLSASCAGGEESGDKQHPRALSASLRRALLFLVATSWGCGPEGEKVTPRHSGTDRSTVHDSAGVSIVVSRDSLWAGATAWSVEPMPLLEIGTRDASGAGTALGRVGPVRLLPDGRVAVGDLQAREVLVFRPDGALDQRWGRPGDGPGEIRSLDDLAVLHDSLVALTNVAAHRHEIYRLDGTYVRTVRAPTRDHFSFGSTIDGSSIWLADGSMVFGPILERTDAGPGPQIVHGEWYTFDGDGGLQGSLVRRPAVVRDGPAERSNEGVVYYAPRAQVVASRLGIWYAWPARWEFHHVTREGLDRVVRLERSREPVSGALRARFHQWLADGPFGVTPGESPSVDLVQIMRGRAQREVRGLPLTLPLVSDSLPAHGPFLVSPEGHLWIQEHATVSELMSGRPDRTSTNRWTVVSPEGRWLGTVQTPAGLRVEDIDDEVVAGVWVDELEVEHVRLHRLVKSN